jgi:CHAD domain-containing protein
MLKKSIQTKFLLKRLESAAKHLENLENFVKTKDPEELHDLRVNIKKLKALVFFSDVANKKSKIKKRFEPVKPIFREAGDVRTAILHKNMLRKHGVKDELLDKQVEAALKKAKDILLNHSTTYIHRFKTIENRMRDHLVDIDKISIEKAFKKQIKKLDKLYADPESELHDSRKTIKHIIYMHDMLPKTMKKNIPLDIPYLKQLEGTLGRWHDDVMAIEFLKKGKAHPKTLTTLQRSVTKMWKTVQTLTIDFEMRVVGLK